MSKSWWVSKIGLVASVLLIISSTVLLLVVKFYPSNINTTSHVQALHSSAGSTNNVPKNPDISGIPVHINIPSLDLELPVDKGYYNNQTQTWTLSGTHAHYAIASSISNIKGGNTFIYGHNNKFVFAKLNQIKTDAIVQITSDNGHRFYYMFRGAVDVNPADTSLFAYQGKPILTVQTCSGSWYQNRRLFMFDLVRAE